MEEQEWDLVADTFDEHILDVPRHDRRGKILQAVRLHGGRRKVAADLGCGIGRTIPMLAGHFGRVQALDISRHCLRRAERTHARFHHVAYHHADLSRELPFPPVDFALCINVLLIAARARRQAMLDNVCASVKPGGHLLLVTPAVESALYATHRLVQLYEADGMKPATAQRKAARDTTRMDMGVVVVNGTPTKHFLKEELADLLMQRGMKVKDIKKIEYPWNYALADAPPDMAPPMPWNWMALAERVP